MESGQITSSDIPPNFRTSIYTLPLLLTGFNAYYGPPEKEAAMVPDYKDKSGDDGWRFDGEFKEGKWLSCDYAGGAIRLATQLDDAIQQCLGVFRHTKNPRLPEAEFRCK